MEIPYTRWKTPFKIYRLFDSNINQILRVKLNKIGLFVKTLT